MPVTQRDVAAKAGVSQVVVSHVLGRGASTVRVSPATAERVREAAQQLNYRLNVSARNFRSQQTSTIGILHGVGFHRSTFAGGSRYFAQLMDGMVEAAFQNGYAITLCPKLLGSDPSDAMSDGRFDGLIWYSAIQNQTSRQILHECPVTLVAIHARGQDVGNAHPTVICDNDQGMDLAIEHLVQLGHRKIVFGYHAELDNLEASIRLQAFKTHMERRGLPTGAEDVLDIDYDRSRLYDYFADGRPKHTAAIGYNEYMAGEFQTAAQAVGLNVPRDFSVVGFDSTAFCNEFRPKLTCVSQPLFDIGAAAVNLLVERMSNPDASIKNVVLPCGIDSRESSGPAPD